jgi:transposase
VQLKINRRQFRCKKCQKIFSEELDFIEKKRGYTKRLAVDIIKQVLDSNIRSVALRNDLTEEEIESMLNAEATLIESINFSQVKRIGIDEIALVKGQGNYFAIIVDLDANKPDEQEYEVAVFAGDEITEVLLGSEWLKILPLVVNYQAEILTLG